MRTPALPACWHVECSTAWGTFRARFSERGLCGLEFPGAERRPEQAGNPPHSCGAWQELVHQALVRNLAGKPAEVMPPLDLTSGTPFQQTVWAALQLIPIGQVRTYGQLAAAIGHPQAARAVGAACGANPVPVLVPCHRVLASNGKLGGFSAGLEWKRRLLAAENHALI